MERKNHYSGLTEKEVIENRKLYGDNLLTPPVHEPWWTLFFQKFEDPIIKILLVAAFLSLAIAMVENQYVETIGIFCAIILATGVSFWFELDASKKFDILNKVTDDTLVKVIRNDHITEITKKEIVKDDIVLLFSGDEVPADGELLEALSLQIDESCLTGESIIVKSTNPKDFEKEATYPSNFVLRGTKVLDGHGVFKVNQVGDRTEYGKLAIQSTQISQEPTPLNRQLDRLAKVIGTAGFGLALLTFLILFLKDLFLQETSGQTVIQFGSVGIFLLSVTVTLTKVWIPIVYDGLELLGSKSRIPQRVKLTNWYTWLIYGLLTFLVLITTGYLFFDINPLEPYSWSSLKMAGKILQYFMIAVTLIVVAVPEGLPMSVTLSLALNMRKMLLQNNLVRKMHACETIGATTVICTDKTGTLTQNQMKISQTYFPGLINQAISDDHISNLITQGIALNTTAHLDLNNPKLIKSIGNPTEAALLHWLHCHGHDYLKIREESEITDQMTFTTERKFMATLVNSPSTNTKILYIKGAPEMVLSRCESIWVEGKQVPIDKHRSIIEDFLQNYQNDGMRTLGFACEIIEDQHQRIHNGELHNCHLSFLGIVAIADPVREDVPEAVEKCLNAGIDIKIITGDISGTAIEVGRRIGIWNSSDQSRNIITGPDFEALNDAQAIARLVHLKIMCRARPSDKQRLVQLLQQSGSVVAVTGDGTNDAPALNFAHVGLSMGSGTAVAKEASDITLLDDSFASIARAVMWGRSLYQNIQRFILFQLTINLTALLIVLLGVIFGKELPLTVTQMLWVNLIMDTFAAIALASLPPNEKIMDQKPRKSSDFIISKTMRKHIFVVGLLFVIILMTLLSYFKDQSGTLTPENLSRFFTVFVLMQFWNMFNAKAFGSSRSAFHNLKHSPGFVLIALIILCGQFLIVQFGGEVFRTVPLPLSDWIIIVGATSIILWIGELQRMVVSVKLM
jgi:P-type Ca2+ transporter type 2C